jgi:RNA polymerase sigma factor (sigma-70 family)
MAVIRGRHFGCNVSGRATSPQPGRAYREARPLRAVGWRPALGYVVRPVGGRSASGRGLEAHDVCEIPGEATVSAVLPRRPLAGRSDAVLVELISDGDEEAFETLVRRYRRELLIYSDRLLGAEGRAEDACQQALLQAWLALRAGTEVDDVRPWLYRIVHNSAVTILRRAHHETVELNEALDSPASDATADSRIILGEIFDRLSAMPEPQREAILMTAVRGRSHAETAAKLGLTDGAVRGLIYRARASLRGAVAGLLPVGLMNWWGRAGSRHVSLAGDASDAAGSAGSAGLAAAVVKGGAVLAAAGALAGTGTVVGSVVSSAGHGPPTHVRPPARPARPIRHAVVGTSRASLSAGPAVIAVESRGSDRSGGSGTERRRHRGRRGPETSRGGPGPSSNERGGESAQGSGGGGKDSGRRQGPGGPGKTAGGGGPGSGSGSGDSSGSSGSQAGSGSSGSGSGGSGGSSGPSGSGSGSGGGSGSSSGEH